MNGYQFQRRALLYALYSLCMLFACTARVPAPAPAKRTLVTSYTALSKLPEGERVTVRCKVAEAIEQHPVEVVAGHPSTAYVDFPDGQSVVYAKSALPASSVPIEISGTVHILEAPSKRPNSNEQVTEWQIVAESVRPLR